MRISLKIVIAAVTFTLLCFVTVTMFGGQIGVTFSADPGIRSGPAGGGQPLAGLTTGAGAFFIDPGLSQFTQVEAVDDGLGPRFNLDSCAGCHIYPAVGGSSPPADFISPDGTRGNPQVGRARFMAPGSTV